LIADKVTQKSTIFQGWFVNIQGWRNVATLAVSGLAKKTAVNNFTAEKSVSALSRLDSYA
jgi:hypothetical protein